MEHTLAELEMAIQLRMFCGTSDVTEGMREQARAVLARHGHASPLRINELAGPCPNGISAPAVFGRAVELLDEAATYTGSPTWSPSLTEEIQDFLLEKAHPPHLCIAPACGPKCSDCNSTISDATMRRYAIRYAYLRDHDPRFGMPTAWLAFQKLDEAIDADLAKLKEQS